MFSCSRYLATVLRAILYPLSFNRLANFSSVKGFRFSSLSIASERIFFTSRVEANREVTEGWLKRNGFKYHSLLMGKPRGGNYHWIDNHLVKATQYKGKFTELVNKEVTIQVFDDGAN